MQRITETRVDKSGWADGPWRKEPDRLQWLDEFTGLPCLVLRHLGRGYLRGYVAIPPGHPFHGRGTADLPMFAVHFGEITYSGTGAPGGVGYTIVPGDDPPCWIGDAWWIGFHGGHAGDICPRDPATFDGAEYRTLGYLTANCSGLAIQLAAYAPGGDASSYLGKMPDRPRFTCPACFAASSDPSDYVEGYCGRCHEMTRIPRGAAGAMFVAIREGRMVGAVNVTRSEDEPVSRLTRLANLACTALEGADESDGNECGVILLGDTAGGEHGSMAFGFDTDDEAIDFLLRHVEALCRAAGRPFQLVNVNTN